MNIYYLTIGIKDATEEEVKVAMQELHICDHIDTIMNVFGVNIVIEDLREELARTDVFLKSNNLKDENDFFNYFEIQPYGLKIDFEINSTSIYKGWLEPVVFLLGQNLSKVLNTQCIVMFESMRIPVGLFKNGSLIAVFDEFNGNFFQNKVWKPGNVQNIT